jgi:outer membrane protein assembly factor BamB
MSKETGLLKEWPAGGPKLLWTAKGCGQGFSSVSIKDGLIYTAGAFPEGTFVVAFDLDGQQKWKTLNAPAKLETPPDKKDWGDFFYKGSRATPTVSDGLVYHLHERGRLAAFDAKTGKEVWGVDLIKDFEGKPNAWGYAESPLVDDKKLYSYPGGKKGYMVALDKKTGKVIWANTDIGDRASNSSAIFVENGGVRQVVTMSTLLALGVDADTGKLLWKYEHINHFKENSETPIYHDGFVLVSSGYGKGTELLKLTRADGQFKAERVWYNEKADNLHGGPILLDGFIYAAGFDCRGWYCLDFKDGQEKYRDEEIGRSSVTYADGMLYRLEHTTSLMSLIAPSSEKCKVVSKFKLAKGGSGYCMAHPVICGGRLYVRHGDCLFAYELKPTPTTTTSGAAP